MYDADGILVFLCVYLKGAREVVRRLQAKLPKPKTKPEGTPALQAVPSKEIHECQWHGMMKESTKDPGTFFCPKKMADGSYCKEKWPKHAGEKSA